MNLLQKPENRLVVCATGSVASALTLRHILTIIMLLLLLGHRAMAESTDSTVTLAGTWRVALDPEDAGPSVLDREINDPAMCGDVWLPGSIQDQGYGNLPTANSPWIGNQRYPEWAANLYEPYRSDNNFKMPYWLTPNRVYVGQAWYERQINIPVAWRGKDIELYLERTHWVTEAWLGDQRLGERASLTTPHIYPIQNVEPGTYTLRLRVDNRMHIDVGPNAHSVSDHTQGNWNGVIGRIELRAMPRVRVEHVRVDGDVENRTAAVSMIIRNTTDENCDANVTVRIRYEGDLVVERTVAMDRLVAEHDTDQAVTLHLGEDAKLWDEFEPNLYEVEVQLTSPLGSHIYQTTFGLREIAVDGTRLNLNGRPIFLRGTLDCLIYPLTGYPPMDEAHWEYVFKQVKEYGLNHVRFHSWCPPRAAFDVADRMGVYLQAEGPFWANQGSQLGLGNPIDDYVYAENDRILETYGNHPSFVLMAYGNEPSGPKKDGSQGQGQMFLGPWLDHVRAKDDRRLYTSGAGWPVMPENQFHNISNPRIQQWGQALNSIINGQAPQTTADHSAVIQRFSDTPIVAHEIGQWCAYPNFAEMRKYTGLLRARNFEIFQNVLHENGMGHLEHDFLMASGALQVLCYKAEIEMALRTRDFAGFQLLDLHDFPGQGTALVGVLDPFWDAKPYVNADTFSAFCGPTVPLARMDRRTYLSGQVLSAEIDISHFGRSDASSAMVAWSLIDDSDEIIADGILTVDLPTGKLTRAGSIEVPIQTDTALRATLHVRIPVLNAHNSWEIWCYPSEVDIDPPDGVHVTRMLDDAAQAMLAEGGTVLLLANPGRVRGGVVMGFSSPFWNYAWTDSQPPHTLGVLVDPEHPLFEMFPTDIHTDWQWWDLVHAGGAMVVDNLPYELGQIVQPIDTWFRARRLSSLFEAKVGGGKLVVCTLDLTNDLDNRIAARQFRHALMQYLGSDVFDPQTGVSIDAINRLFREPTLAERMGVTATATSAHGGYEPSKAIDGDPSTFWHTDFSGNVMQPHPHHLTLEFAAMTNLTGFGYTARSDSANGQIGRYTIQVSDDGVTWGEPIAVGRFDDRSTEQVIEFDRPTTTRYLRLVAVDSINGQPYSAVAELRPITP